MNILKLIYGIILKMAHFVGRINTFILISFFYFAFIGLAKLGHVLLRKDPLDRRWKDRDSYWRKRNATVTPEAFRDPF